MSCRVGSLVFTTDQGLGILAKSFFDAGVITDVMVVAHGRRQEHPEWYPGAQRIGNLNDHSQYADMRAFCAKMDAMLFFETPFRWELFEWCKACKTKTAIMPMYECMPKQWPARPDVIINPSALDQRYYPRGVHIPVPVQVPWRRREQAEVFVHNAGNGGLKGRNGTAELVQALPHIKSAAKIVLTSQVPLAVPGVDVRVGTLAYEELWRDGGVGDAFVFPEKFNGLSLPLQEARAAGMLVMGTDRFPMNEWLPREPLIPIKGTRRANVAGRCEDFDEAIIEPQDIAAKIDSWFGRDISVYSEAGREWAASMSWDVLKPRYMEVLA